MASSCTAADRTNLTNFNNSLSNCTTTADSTFNSHIGTSTHINEDIDQLRANVLDSLHMGDAMFAKTGHLHIAEEVQHRNKELKEKKEKLTQEIKKGEAIIQKSNRDFSDVKNSLPETSPKKILHVLEDYTVAFLSITYLFMVCIGVYFYVISSSDYWNAFLRAMGATAILTVIMGTLLFYIA